MKTILITILFLPLFAQAQVILTVAGTGVQGYSGDGGTATTAMLHNPSGVIIDNSGDLYICDANCIRKVSPAYNGIISTVAGNGVAGFSGDGGPAVYAKIFGVHDIAIDYHGNLYLADAVNNRIRKVAAADGIINTIAGTGTAGYNGDGIAATAAQLNSPLGVAVDDIGNLYIADAENYRIRMIDTAGVIHTFAGTGTTGFTADGGSGDTARLNHIGSIRIDKAGNIFFGDNLRIRKITSGGTIATVAGNGTLGFSGDGGLATGAQLGGGIIDIDTIGNIFIAEQVNNRVRKVNSEGIITTIAGTGIGTYNGDEINPLLSNVSSPHGVAVGLTGDVFIGDQGNNRVRMITYTWNDVKDIESVQPDIIISPNPCHDNCTLLIKTPIIKTANIVITNAAGMQVWNFEASTNQEVAIPVTHLPCGLYVVRATIDRQQFTSKLILE